MASAGSASAGLDTLDVLEVVAGDGGAPGTDGGEVRGDFGKGFEAVGFVAGDGEAGVGMQLWKLPRSRTVARDLAWVKV